MHDPMADPDELVGPKLALHDREQLAEKRLVRAALALLPSALGEHVACLVAGDQMGGPADPLDLAPAVLGEPLLAIHVQSKFQAGRARVHSQDRTTHPHSPKLPPGGPGGRCRTRPAACKRPVSTPRSTHCAEGRAGVSRGQVILC